MSRAAARTRIAAVALGLVLPGLAHACAVCFSGSPKVREAFFNMTIMLSLVPLALLFAGVWALRRASGIKASEEFAVTDNSVAVPVGDAGDGAGSAAIALPKTAKRPGAVGPEAIGSS